MNKFEFCTEPIRWYPVREIGKSDVCLCTPEQNFGSGGVAREINAIYEDVPRNNVVWQPDVYVEARAVAEQFGIRRIIDVGCGSGEKLIHFFPAEQFETLGLDFHGSLKLASGAFPDARWMECDLNSSQDLYLAFDELDPNEPVLLILSDVIQHLPDPRLLLAQLRTVLMRHLANRLVLSTPDRRLLRHKTYGTPPENYAHVREWTIDELATFCNAAGFQVERCGHTRANQLDEEYSTIYAQLRCELSHYLSFLKGVGLLHGDALPRHLLLTAEYAGLHNTGGIGTFVVEQRLTYGLDNTLCLFIAQQDNLDAASFRRHQLIGIAALVDGVDLTLPLEDIALKATQQILFYFSAISKIEYADYQGFGCRLAQAKRAGLLPPSVQIVVHCHGATHYLENANQTWYGKSHFGTAEREKISIENADQVVFPTAFLHDLYRETGIEIAEQNVVRLRYPYHFEPVEICRTEPVDTVVFFGKRSAMKGYGLFLGALASDQGRLRNQGIKRIVFIGPRISETEEDRSLIDLLRTQFDVVEFTSLGRSAAMDQLRSCANNAFCVMPYLGDNHPYALLDVTFAGVLPLMLRAGGVAELFPAPFDRILLADPSEASLLAGMIALVNLSVEERHRLRVDFLNSMKAAQTATNEATRVYAEAKTQAQPTRPFGKATVIVPVFNTDMQFIRDLVYGLNNQSMAPAEVVFVDDASRLGYADGIEELLRRELRLPYRVVRHATNKGLAGARNTGLAAASTDYVINVDSDDVPLNDFVRDIVCCLEAQPHYAAAVPYLKTFNEDADFNLQVFGGDVFRPLGDGVVVAQLDNVLGHANSGYRVSVLRALGGWDETEKSMWEDWALFLKLTSSGHRIGVIPKIGCLYRVRKNSMLRTYKVWPAMRRLARNMEALPRFDSFRLQSAMRHWRDEEAALHLEVARLRDENAAMHLDLTRLRDEEAALHLELARLRDENCTISEQLNRASIRVMRRIVAHLARSPRQFALARFIGAAGWRTAKWVGRRTVDRSGE